MTFTKDEIELARRLKRLGLNWPPAVGHYVWDETNVINCDSPFHDSVFYILDLKHFLRRCHSIEQMQQHLCWLPTWYDARLVLDSLKVPSETIAGRIEKTKALENGTERLCLFEIIERTILAKRSDSGSSQHLAV